MLSEHAANIVSVARRATPREIEAGYSWYPLAHDISAEIAPDIRYGAGVIAALSPMMPWHRNVMLARAAFAEGGLMGGALSTNVAKANRIAAGNHPLTVLGGRKVLSFYDNIVNPTGDSVTIDRHALDIAHNRVMPDSLKSRIGGKALYTFYSAAYREAADYLGIHAPELQAITWVAWRRMKGIAD